MTTDTLLVGLGMMGCAYAKVLQSLDVSTVAVGRSLSGAETFTAGTGVRACAGGVLVGLDSCAQLPRSAIVCVSVEETLGVVTALLNAGIKRILVEKPGATTPGEIETLSQRAKMASAEVFIAYNRRFYASVAEARRRIEAEGGLNSFHFEFTERESDVNAAKFTADVKAHWALANSSHVIDLAFFLGGKPVTLSSEIAGSLPWHPAGARFAGCGRSERGALFSYCANWTSGGRWSVELMTPQSRLILRPLEQLFVQRRGSFEIAPVDLDNRLDMAFKPGLHRQTESFLKNCADDLVTLEEQAQRARKIFAPITGEGSPA